MGEPQLDARAMQIGRYRLIRMLGRGGMAEVWLARVVGPAQFERKVVVKQILEQHAGDESFAKMFLAEARLCARLNHPNIVAVHELGEEHGRYFIAMEYVNGRDLRQLMHELAGQPSVSRVGLATFVVREVARALGYAHTLTSDDGKPLQLVHRDVSHSNVMLSFEGNVKLVDFGLAKALAEMNEERTRTGVLKGKFGYMAPEQLTTVPLDHRIDLWSLGVMLWELLTGRKLFRGGTDVQTLAMVREAPIEAPSWLNKDVSPALDAVVMRALERDRERRYQSGEELAHALELVGAGTEFGPAELKTLMHAYFEERSSNSSELATELIPVAATVAAAPQSLIAPKVRSRFAFVVFALLSISMCGIGGYLSARRPTVLVAPSPPTAAPVISAPSRVEVTVQSMPPGARVFLDDAVESRGVTPLALQLGRGAQKHRLRLELDGYQPHVETINSERDSQLLLNLVARPLAPHVERAHAERHAATKPVSAPTPRPGVATPHPIDVKPAKAQTNDSLREGKTLDPFE